MVLPLAAALAAAFIRSGRKCRWPGWIAIATLAYTTFLLALAGVRVYAGEVLTEQYRLGPDVSLNLLADGLSLPMAMIINLICLALAFYSLHYVEHRIELIYGQCTSRVYNLY